MINYHEVPRLDHPNLDDFKKNYFEKEKPAVLNWFIDDWEAKKKWNFEYFKRQWGDNQVKLFSNDFARPGKSYMSKVDYVPLKEYVQELIEGRTTHRMFLYNIAKEAPQLLNDLNLKNGIPGFSENYVFMFFGSAGSVTQLHFDIDLSHVFHVAFEGEKTFYLFDKNQSKYLYQHPFTIRSYINPEKPDYIQYPGLAQAQGYKVTLRPGETLYIPTGYWHHVVYHSASFALSLRCAHQNPAMRAKGIYNIVALNMIDRLVNYFFPTWWYAWKVRRSREMAVLPN